MNRDFDIIYYAKRWFKPANRESDEARNSNPQVPYICIFMPLRWSYESVIISHAKLNPISSFQGFLKKRIRTLADSAVLGPEDEKHLRQAKDALAVTFGLQGESVSHIRAQLRQIRSQLDAGTFEAAPFYPESGARYSAENLYLNEKVLDLVNIAEAERTDYRYSRNIFPDQATIPASALENIFPNVFFGTRKCYGSPRIAKTPDGEPVVRGTVSFNTLYVNAAVMALYALIGLIAVHTVLRRQLTKV